MSSRHNEVSFLWIMTPNASLPWKWVHLSAGSETAWFTRQYTSFSFACSVWILSQKYLDCLKQERDLHHKCRELSKEYLQCRMDRQLMAQEDLNNVSTSLYNDRRWSASLCDCFLTYVNIDGICRRRSSQGRQGIWQVQREGRLCGWKAYRKAQQVVVGP